jgi:hypothetical protein
MLHTTLLLLVLPVGALLAQNSPIHLIISSPNHAEFRVVRAVRDSSAHPLFGRGRLELAANDAGDSGTSQATEILALDTLNNVHVDVTEGGRVIASGDGRFLTVRRDQNGIAIEARSVAPASALHDLRRP